MKKLQFSYEMNIAFTSPVTQHRFTLKCIPCSTGRQNIEQLHVKVYPNYFLEHDEDSFGNQCIYGYCEIPHDHFSVSVTGTAATGLSHYETAADEYKLGMYKYTTHYTRPGSALLSYYSRLRQRFKEQFPAAFVSQTGGSPVLPPGSGYAWALFVTQQLYQDFKYQSGVTDIYTTAEAALTQGCGVCQDYSHIMIALMHMAGVPARYVVGMLMGEGLSHAWVEVYEKGMWIGLDPTNNQVVSDRHIKISHGRDYKDCTINHGFFTGNAAQSQSIRVLVTEEAIRQEQGTEQ